MKKGKGQGKIGTLLFKILACLSMQRLPLEERGKGISGKEKSAVIGLVYKNGEGGR